MTEPFIRVEGLYFTYSAGGEQPVPALRGIDLEIAAGEYVVIVGHNGSGKSTLARHFNALLLPSAGRVLVAGMDTRDPKHTLTIRQRVGMVFQEPDNQIIGTVVEEDTAFGPENLGVPPAELRERVRWALEQVGLWQERGRAPNLLSAGQKQRLAIAGVLAMRPACVVLDEATALLDPAGRAEVLAVVRRLHAAGTTIVAITHLMEEAVEADRVLVLSAGRLALSGAPADVFAQGAALRELRLQPPAPARLAEAVHRRCPALSPHCLTVPTLADAIAALAQPAAGAMHG
jgi:energy-coupling factor transporter ATPase